MSYSVGAAGMFSHTAFVSFRRFAELNDIMDILYSLFINRVISGEAYCSFFLGTSTLGRADLTKSEARASPATVREVLPEEAAALLPVEMA